MGSSTGAPKPAIAWGMAAKRVRVPKCLRAKRGLVEKRRSDEAGSAAQPVAPFAKAKLASYSSATPRTHRTHAQGDRVLPDLVTDRDAVSPTPVFSEASGKKRRADVDMWSAGRATDALHARSRSCGLYGPQGRSADALDVCCIVVCVAA